MMNERRLAFMSHRYAKARAVASVLLLAVLFVLKIGMSGINQGVYAADDEGKRVPVRTLQHAVDQISDNMGRKSAVMLQTRDKNSPRHFMVGYGSLINRQSRSKTAQTGSVFPVRINGYVRKWCYPQPSRRMTALCAVRAGVRTAVSSKSLNGVLFRVAGEVLPQFDQRELHYTRIQVPHNQIEVLNPRGAKNVAGELRLTDADRVWIYVYKSPSIPTRALPIAQSYVDVVVAGCLQWGDEFARECVRDTGNWKGEGVHWVEDRNAPLIYKRGFVATRVVKQVDELLSQLVHDSFIRRQHSGRRTS